jgi:hypothetical protein
MQWLEDHVSRDADTIDERRTRAIITAEDLEAPTKLERVPIFGAFDHASELLCMIAVWPVLSSISRDRKL